MRTVEQTRSGLTTKVSVKELSWLAICHEFIAGGQCSLARCSLEEMVELGNAAWRPLETAVSVAQVAHDVTIFPTASLGSGTAEVTGWWRAVVDRAQTAKVHNAAVRKRRILTSHNGQQRFEEVSYRWPTS